MVGDRAMKFKKYNSVHCHVALSNQSLYSCDMLMTLIHTHIFYNGLTYSFCIVFDGYKYICLYVVSYICTL